MGVAIYSAMTKGLTEDQVADFKEAFAFFDKNKDGFISVTELKPVMMCLGEKESNLEKVIKMANKQQNGGNIEISQFLALMAETTRDDTEEELIEAFKVFDKDGDGKISDDELRRVMTSFGEELTEEEIEEIIKEGEARLVNLP